MNYLDNTNVQITSRIWQYDLLKSYTCFLVVWGHAIMHLSASDYLDNPLYRFIYSFHMSLFMMISGMFSSSAISLPCSSFVKKKFMQLIYPCLIWGLINFIILDGYSFFKNSISIFTYSKILSDLYWYSDFWFLKSCFVCFCLSYIGTKLCKRTWKWVIITLLVSQFIPVFQVSFMYPAFLTGLLIKKYNLMMCIIIKYKYIIWISFILMSLFWSRDAWIGSHGVSLELFDGLSLSLISLITLRFFRMLIGVCGALSFLLLFQMINKPLYPNIIRHLCDYGQNTLEIYIIHSVFFVNVVCQILSFSGLSYFQFNFIVTPIVSIIVIVLCNCIIYLLRKKELLFYLFFGRTRK